METKSRSKNNFHSVFELIFKYLPAGEFALIIGPLILFGMFTWGLSPDDPQLRQGYYSLFLVVLPLAFTLGNLLSRISRSQVTLGILDLAGGIITGLCFLWFFAKVSLVPPEAPVEYMGWNWREWYQYFLLLPLVGVKACRLGMISYSFAGVQIPSSVTKTSFYAVASASGIITLQYLGAFLLGFWPWFFIFIVFWDMLGAWRHLILKEGNLIQKPRTDSKSHLPKAFHERLLRVAMPFMIGTQGIYWGLTYSTTMWTQTWLGLFGLVTGIATVLLLLFLKFQGDNLLSRTPSFLPLIIVAFLGASLAFLLTRWVQPMDVIWSVINGISLGGFLIMGTQLYLPPRRAFWGSYRLLTFIFLFLLGVGGGIAYFWYDPEGEMYGPWVLLVCVLITGVLTTIAAIKRK